MEQTQNELMDLQGTHVVHNTFFFHFHFLNASWEVLMQIYNVEILFVSKSIMEMSHRSPEFTAIVNGTIEKAKKLL